MQNCVTKLQSATVILDEGVYHLRPQVPLLPLISQPILTFVYILGVFLHP